MLTILAGSMAAFGQQKAHETEPPDEALKVSADPCAEFDPEAVRAALEGESQTTGKQPASGGEPEQPPLSEACLKYLEAQRKAREAEPAEGEKDANDGEGIDSQPDDEDFKPDEEISEDYPVPLPSDI